MKRRKEGRKEQSNRRSRAPPESQGGKGTEETSEVASVKVKKGGEEEGRP